jgi:hypothetical protein
MAVVGTCVATAGLLACSSAASNGTGPGADGGGGNDGQVSNADGAMPGVDGSPGGGDGSVATGQGSGLILVTQLVTASAAQSGVTAGFNSTAVVPAGCTKTMVAGCFATSCPVVMGILRSSLNAGTITVTGTGPSSPATLTFGPFGGDAGINGYKGVDAPSKFYNDGDTLSASGAGGPDLPAFAAQTLVAPTDIVLTAPACANVVCANFARSTDATLTWTGGGAGNVGVTYITDTDNGSKTLSCSFAAAAGTGTVPSAALMMLDVGTAPGFTGVEVISPNNSKTFMVGTLPTLFEAQGSGIEGSFTTTD